MTKFNETIREIGMKAESDGQKNTACGDPDVSPSRDAIDLATRIDDLQRTLDELVAGKAGIAGMVADAAANHLTCEIEIMLWPDVKLARFLQVTDDPGTCTRRYAATAAAREFARRRTLSAHARIAEARVRARLARP